MYSFYGGRPGNSFIIITTYRSIKDMINQFKKGPDYTAVHYDEYVMINTDNKNDPDNGKIYRRGYNFTDENGGAQYVGTIVGPAGKAPLLEMTTIADVKTKHAKQGYEQRRSSGQYSPQLKSSLVPGKVNENTFNDSIKWECCSIRNENNQDCTAYIGFTFPYLVIDCEASSVKPYNDKGTYIDNSSITRIDDEKHPFFAKWHLNIPKGIKGDTFMNLKVEPASENIQDYDGREDDIENNRLVLTYDYYNYDNKENGSPKKIYLGDYNMINNISIDDQGTVIIDYTHDNNQVFDKKIKWINSISLNDNTGLLTVKYNHETDSQGEPTEYTVYLDWIKSVDIANDGTVTFGHSHKEPTVFNQKIKWINNLIAQDDGTLTFQWNNGSDTVLDKMIKWIQSINLQSDGTLTIRYNNGSSDDVFSKKIKWISDITLSNDGTLIVSYNNGDEPKIFSKIIKWISDISLSNDGSLTINYNNDEEPKILQNKVQWISNVSLSNDGILKFDWNNNTPSTELISTPIKWISDTSIAPDGTMTITYNNRDTKSWDNLMTWPTDISINTDNDNSNQKLHITWNDGTSQDVGKPINYIMNMIVNNNNHLLVRYSDPQKRGQISYGDYQDWADLGSINQQYEYDRGDQVTDLYWRGVGEIVDSGGTGNKKIYFNINPIAFINPEVNDITITAGQLYAKTTDGTTIVAGLDLSTEGTTTVTKTLTGLNFQIDTGQAVGTPMRDFVNISVRGLGMGFGVSFPQ